MEKYVWGIVDIRTNEIWCFAGDSFEIFPTKEKAEEIMAMDFFKSAGGTKRFNVKEIKMVY